MTMRNRSFVSTHMSLIRMYVPQVEGACREEGHGTGGGRREVGRCGNDDAYDWTSSPSSSWRRGGEGAPRFLDAQGVVVIRHLHGTVPSTIGCGMMM
jgi:hypothetical protein